MFVFFFWIGVRGHLHGMAPGLPELSAQSYNIILTTKSRARGNESLSENPDIPKKLDREVPLGA
jgi:hypothetical protein